MKRQVTVRFAVDMEDYEEPDTDEAAAELARAMLKGEADLPKTVSIECGDAVLMAILDED